MRRIVAELPVPAVCGAMLRSLRRSRRWCLDSPGPLIPQGPVSNDTAYLNSNIQFPYNLS